MSAGTQSLPVVADTAADDYKAARYSASQWKLMWWRFKRHKLALVSLYVLGLLYAFGLLAEFVVPYSGDELSPSRTYAPPQALHLLDDGWRWSPHVFAYRSKVDPVALRRTFEPDFTKPIPVGFFVPGPRRHLLGLIPIERRLIGPIDPRQPMHLVGTDKLGRDVLSRLAYGARISLSIGLIGVGLSLVLGVAIGGLSGYLGGWTDNLVQRVIELIRSIPTIPLWMGLAAALPQDWSPLTVYFAITVILSFVGWTGLARVVRGRFMSMKNEEFVLAATIDGNQAPRLIYRHMLPGMASHLIAAATLAVPFMIISETALSFLGIGLKPPVVSWGTMLQDAQNVRAILQAPWLLAPATLVVTAILAFNFVGDGMRDAADPYAH